MCVVVVIYTVQLDHSVPLPNIQTRADAQMSFYRLGVRQTHQSKGCMITSVHAHSNCQIFGGQEHEAGELEVLSNFLNVDGLPHVEVVEHMHMEIHSSR